MKIIVGTDFHGNEAMFKRLATKALEVNAEVIVVCGDITHFGLPDEAVRLLSLLIGLKIPVLFVPGNCDPPSLASMYVEGAKCIHGKSVTYNDVTFLGVGGSPPTPFNTPFEMTEEKIMETLMHTFKNLLNSHWIVLVSHSPPVDTNLDKTLLGHHVGSSSVRKFIEESKPSVVFCGHIHEAKGKDQIGNSILINPGPARHGDYAQVFFNSEVTFNFFSL